MNKVLTKYLDLVINSPSLFTNDAASLRIITDASEILEWQEVKREQLRQKHLPLNWADIGIILEDPFIFLIRDLVEFPDLTRNGYIRSVNRDTLQGGQGVVILAKNAEKFLLLHQYRHATRSWHLEIPRGCGEPGILAEDQAKTEIKEETGGEISTLVNLGYFYNNSAFEGSPVYLFFAQVSLIGEPAKNEGIDKFVWVDIVELERLIRDGEITDGFTIAAYTRAKLSQLI
ncbi:MAG: NUDIX hydrolase [Dehalococcoidales bacterium]|nr:NUDIX hydrolase [Dehalococcoidales bacterium]